MVEQNDPIPEQRTERLAVAMAAGGWDDSVPPVHGIWRLAGVAGSVAVAVSVYMPWIPLRGLERENLADLIATLSRIGVPSMIWVVPLAAGAAGLAAGFIRHRTIRGIILAAVTVALVTISALVRPDMVRAANAAALVPLTFRSFGPGIYVYASGLAAMCAAGFQTCWPSPTGRLTVIAFVAVGVVVSAVVPRLREPLPDIIVQPGGERIGAEPARIVHVSFRNRARHPISVVDSRPADPDSSVYVMSLDKRTMEDGTFTEVSPVTAFTQGTSFPVTIREKDSIDINLEFRPVWTSVPGSVQTSLPFGESAAGTYRISLANSAFSRRADTEFVVEPVSHPQTDAAALLAEVHKLVARAEFTEARIVAQRLEERYPATWATRQIRSLYPHIEASASLDSEIAGAEKVLLQVARFKSAGDTAADVRLLDTVRERLAPLKKALPEDTRLNTMVERVKEHTAALRRKMRETEVRRMFADMQTAVEQNDIDRAGALASKLVSDYSSIEPYAEMLPDIERVLRLERLVRRFELVSIVNVGSKVQALLLDTETGKRITVGSGDVIAGDVRVVRIDDPAGTVLIEQSDLNHELAVR